jgi:hypothetical protein
LPRTLSSQAAEAFIVSKKPSNLIGTQADPNTASVSELDDL